MIRLTRRQLLISSAALSVLPRIKPVAAQDAETRKIFNAVTGEPIVINRFAVKRVGKRGRWIFSTDAEGAFPFGEMLDELGEPAVVRIKIPGNQLNRQYAAVDLRMRIDPFSKNIDKIGDLGLIPLELAPGTLGITNQVFFDNWLDLLKGIFFNEERSVTPPKGAITGALRKFSLQKPVVYVDTSFSSAERAFVITMVKNCLKALSGGYYDKLRAYDLPAVDVSLDPGNYEPGSIVIARRDDYSRPGVRIRYGDQATPAEGESPFNPNMILSSTIILDYNTMDELYRNGSASTAELNHVKNRLFKAVAYATGWRPTMQLPGRSIVDENYNAPGATPHPLITNEDRALALAASGGGSFCYPPGTRFIARTAVTLRSDPDYPLSE